MAKRPEVRVNPGAATAVTALPNAEPKLLRREAPSVNLDPESIATQRLLSGASVMQSATANPAEGQGLAVKVTFSIPPGDLALIEALKQRAINDHRRQLSKSGAVRAGLKLLAALNDVAFHAAIAGIEDGRPGRRKNKE